MMQLRILLVLIAVTAAAAHAAGPHGTQYGQPMTDTGQVMLTDEVAQALADSGAGFVRVNFRLGPYAYDTSTWYTAYDGIVNRLRSRGLEVIGLLTNEACQPTWDSSKWKENAYETTGGNGWNNYLNDWCNIFLRMAKHWNGKIKYWELWNEPDCLATIYPSNYGALLANAYDLVRTAGLDVEIISGGVCGGYDPYGPDYISKTYNVSINHTGWFTQMKNKWGTYPLDHIGFHIYPNCNGPLDTNWLSNYFDYVRNSYTAYEGANSPKKMFLTEIGWMTSGGCYVSEAMQAANLTAAFNLANSKPYIQHVNWFFLRDTPSAGLYYGLYRSTGLSESDKKPALASFKAACTFEGRWSTNSIDQPILDYFNARGRAAMGNPYDNGGTAWVHNWDFGPVQDYNGGSLGRMVVFNTADGTACSARGNFYETALQYHLALEFPLSDQFFTGIGEKQLFEGGYATWTSADGTQVTLYDNKLILDNTSPTFSVSSNWSAVSASDAYNGNYHRRKGTPVNIDPATWTFTIPTAGYYDVYVRFPTVAGSVSAAKYEIVHASGTSTVTLSQQSRSGRWNRLGTYSFNAGSAEVKLSSQGSTSLYVLADAVRLIGPTAGPDTTPPTPVIVTDDGTFQTSTSRLRASWTSVDMESGIVQYEYAIGTTPTDPGSGYLVPWTSTGTATNVTKVITLTAGTTYYFYVRAQNGAGMVSQGVSDGITVDNTAPTKPEVIDDGDYTGDPTLLHCSWTCSDPQSGITEYYYAVGSNPGYYDIVPITSAGTATQTWIAGLNLTPGATYYLRVHAKNGSGLTSSFGVSDGIVYQPATPVDTVAAALALPDETVVLLKNKLVTGLFGDRFYIQEPDGYTGVAIGRPADLVEGARVDITGRIRTIAGERVIVPGAVTPVQQ